MEANARARPAGRPREPRVDEAVRAATLEVLRKRGYGGVTMEGVAARAGVGKAAIYRRFPTKAELVFAAAVHGLELPPPEDTGSLRGDLEALIRRIVGLLTRPVAAAAVPGLLADLGSDRELAARFEQTFISPARGVVAAALDQAVARGELRATPDPELVHVLLLGPLFTWVHVLRRPPAELVERLAEHVAGALLSNSSATEKE